jgi:tyrosine-protein phosphatase SIW14
MDRACYVGNRNRLTLSIIEGTMRLSSRSVRLRSAAVVAACSLVISLAPANAGASATIAIDNFGRVDGTYYRGGQPQGKDYEDLASLGVKTIINLTSDDADPSEPAMAARAGLRYAAIPMTTHRQPSSTQIDQFLRIVNDPASQPVYVHCVGGRHRTGVMTATYRMTHDGWTPDRAFAEMKQYKFGADFLHPEFKAFVLSYRAPSGGLKRTVEATKAGS